MEYSRLTYVLRVMLCGDDAVADGGLEEAR
jgi:hypothetical protein